MIKFTTFITILAISWEEEITLIHAKDSVIFREIENQVWYDYLLEDLESVGINKEFIKHPKIMEAYQKDRKEKINLLREKGWVFELKRNIKITK